MKFLIIISVICALFFIWVGRQITSNNAERDLCKQRGGIYMQHGRSIWGECVRPDAFISLEK